jgi:hypothetical protein
MGMSGQRHAPAAFYPRGKDPRYPLERRLHIDKCRYEIQVQKEFRYGALTLTIYIFQKRVKIINDGGRGVGC